MTVLKQSSAIKTDDDNNILKIPQHLMKRFHIPENFSRLVSFKKKETISEARVDFQK